MAARPTACTTMSASASDLAALVERYRARTASAVATQLLAGWETSKRRFLRVRHRLLVDRERALAAK